MSNETKRDVLKKALDFFVATWLLRNINYGLERYQYLSEYDAALPDDLPVIPKEVSDYISKAKKHRQWGLLDVFWHLGDHISAMGFKGLCDWERWMVDNQDAVSRAWLDGVWRVEESGEIVKLEEEK